MIKITLSNMNEFSTNPDVLALIEKGLNNGLTLAISKTNEVLPHGQYYCTSDTMGIIQKINA